MKIFLAGATPLGHSRMREQIRMTLETPLKTIESLKNGSNGLKKSR
jgi:hypothetical protein